MSALFDSLLASDGETKRQSAATLKALAWARVSTDMQEERGLSIPEQLRQIREYAEANGIVIL